MNSLRKGCSFQGCVRCVGQISSCSYNNSTMLAFLSNLVLGMIFSMLMKRQSSPANIELMSEFSCCSMLYLQLTLNSSRF